MKSKWVKICTCYAPLKLDMAPLELELVSGDGGPGSMVAVTLAVRVFCSECDTPYAEDFRMEIDDVHS